jgi:hypothetical protein
MSETLIVLRAKLASFCNELLAVGSRSYTHEETTPVVKGGKTWRSSIALSRLP